MKIAISGSTGFIGSALTKTLREGGHEAVPLVRRGGKEQHGGIPWDPSAGWIKPGALDGFDAIIHLGGFGLAEKRWNERVKEKILKSRIDSTRTLVTACENVSRRPHTFICASAIGFYGTRGSELLSEESSSGPGFLATVCREWEAEARRATSIGMRVVSLRSGMVLDPSGGALQKMLLPFRLGLGGPLGSGAQFWSWISLADEVAAIVHLLRSSVSGPVNMVSPGAVTNREFTKCLANALGRPAKLAVPAFALQAIFGREMADELFFSSIRAAPNVLIREGFSFRYRELGAAFKELLN